MAIIDFLKNLIPSSKTTILPNQPPPVLPPKVPSPTGTEVPSFATSSQTPQEAQNKFNAPILPGTGASGGSTTQGKPPAAIPNVTVKDMVPAQQLNGQWYNKAGDPVPAPSAPPMNADGTPMTPGQQLAAHISNTMGGAGAKKPATGTGLMSASDQTAAASAISSSAATSAGSARAAFDAATNGSGTDPIISQIETNLQTLMAKASTPPPSLLDQYNSLLQSSGIQADQQAALNLETMMSGTVDDIRQELTAHGGFATESQIQGLTSQRNFFLQRSLTTLQQGISMKQSWIDSTMQYTGQDYTNAQNNFEKNFQLQDTLLSTLQRAQSAGALQDYRFQSQQMAQLKFAVDSGKQMTPDEAATYSATTGIPADQILGASTNQQTKMDLTTALQASLLQTRNQTAQFGSAAMGADVALNNRTISYLKSKAGTDGMVSSSDYQGAFQNFIASGKTAAEFINQFPPTDYMTNSEIMQLNPSIPEFQTIQFNSELQSGVNDVIANGADPAKNEKLLLARYPDQATKIKDAFTTLGSL